MLPVNTSEKSPSWDFDGNLDAPTLSPSILTRGSWAGEDPEAVRAIGVQPRYRDDMNTQRRKCEDCGEDEILVHGQDSTWQHEATSSWFCAPHDMTTDDVGPQEAHRCRCLTPVGTRCLWYASQEDLLCDACRIGKPVGRDGLHWCARSSTPTHATDGSGA